MTRRSQADSAALSASPGGGTHNGLVDLLRFLVMPFVVFLGAIAALWLRDRLASRRRRGLRDGGAYRCRALLGGDEESLRPGSLALASGAATWRDRAGSELDLRGTRLLSRQAEPDLHQARVDDVLLHLARPDGTRLQLLLSDDDAAAFLTHLGY